MPRSLLLYGRQVPEGYDATHKHFAAQGARVIALARRMMPADLSGPELRGLSREEVETNMEFEGFAVFQVKGLYWACAGTNTLKRQGEGVSESAGVVPVVSCSNVVTSGVRSAVKDTASLHLLCVVCPATPTVSPQGGVRAHPEGARCCQPHADDDHRCGNMMVSLAGCHHCLQTAFMTTLRQDWCQLNVAPMAYCQPAGKTAYAWCSVCTC